MLASYSIQSPDEIRARSHRGRDYAFEWGTLSGRTKLSDGTVRDEHYKLLRILRRDPDGWKVHRAIWNTLGI